MGLFVVPLFSCDEGSLTLVCQLVHRVLASLSASQGQSAAMTSSVTSSFKQVVETALQICIPAFVLSRGKPPLSAPPSATFPLGPGVGVVFPSSPDLSARIPDTHSSERTGGQTQAAKILVAILDVLEKDCWVWAYINAISCSPNTDTDTDTVTDSNTEGIVSLWTQMINVVCANVVLEDSAEEASKTFTKHCTHLLAMLLNKVSQCVDWCIL